ncbi:hypothetical protein HK097_002134 [Rhizophlyctis rosea]|uniref:RRM domain-containing protein n=1 Tax=Rhizophlyctis rosea TaxID=64517 RepID=A0AAD5SN04_9FUNG|nr:hypothetical protein HK097_002134 [Rhizophlyctis rosea]
MTTSNNEPGGRPSIITLQQKAEALFPHMVISPQKLQEHDSTQIFVGNLAWSTNDDSLHAAFSTYGQVTNSIVLKDQETQRSRGFGFVTYDRQEDAQAAIEAMDGQQLDGRQIRVNIANESTSGEEEEEEGPKNTNHEGNGSEDEDEDEDEDLSTVSSGYATPEFPQDVFENVVVEVRKLVRREPDRRGKRYAILETDLITAAEDATEFKKQAWASCAVELHRTKKAIESKSSRMRKADACCEGLEYGEE